MSVQLKFLHTTALPGVFLSSKLVQTTHFEDWLLPSAMCGAFIVCVDISNTYGDHMGITTSLFFVFCIEQRKRAINSLNHPTKFTGNVTNIKGD